MGTAAYNRGSARIRKQFDNDAGDSILASLESLNSLVKYEDAGTPFGTTFISEGNRGWWIECPTTGAGWWYRSIHECVKRWRVAITGYDAITHKFECVPIMRNFAATVKRA